MFFRIEDTILNMDLVKSVYADVKIDSDHDESIIVNFVDGTREYIRADINDFEKKLSLAFNTEISCSSIKTAPEKPFKKPPAGRAPKP